MEMIKQLKQWLKNRFAYGGYELGCYTKDGFRLCRDCVLDHWASIVNSTLHNVNDGWGIMSLDAYWEGSQEYCDDCGHIFESEYGDPNESLNIT